MGLEFVGSSGTIYTKPLLIKIPGWVDDRRPRGLGGGEGMSSLIWVGIYLKRLYSVIQVGLTLQKCKIPIVTMKLSNNGLPR